MILIMDNWYRYWDLIRWHQLDKLDSTKYPNTMLGANVSNVPDCEEATKNGYIDASDAQIRTYVGSTCCDIRIEILIL